MKFHYKIAVLTFLIMLLGAGGDQATAQSERPQLGLMPAKTVTLDEQMGSTHPMIRITPDKSELVRLNRDAISVIVGNPAHVNVLLDTPRVLVLVPRAPGATHFTVLDQAGGVIMQRHVIVASPKEKYIRVRRNCGGIADARARRACQDTSVYYCPDICHTVAVTPANAEQEENDIPEETPTLPIDQIPEEQ